jgi:two-component system, OmpR family, KDP operon response regulator KdpE
VLVGHDAVRHCGGDYNTCRCAVAGGGARSPPPGSERRRRILLCDCESQTLHALRIVLHRAGFEVDATRGVTEALDRGALTLPAAAIIDLVLPDGDGVDVCRRLRERSAMPVIMLSAVGAEEEQVRALEAGADDYMTKPFRPRELVARVLANLRRADRGREDHA